MVSQLTKDQFRTPEDLFSRYDAIYQFTIDGAASVHDSLGPNYGTMQHYWGPGSQLVGDFFDTTADDWDRERVWVNPPYSMTEEFLAHAAQFHTVCPVSVWLLPAWPDRAWWHDFVWDQTGPRPGVSVEFLRGRVKFLNPDGSLPPNGGKFPSVVVTFRGRVAG